MYDDVIFLAAPAKTTTLMADQRGTIGQRQRNKQYLFHFHVFYTVADACWLPAQRLYLH